jgi:hypothetical protein
MARVRISVFGFAAGVLALAVFAAGCGKAPEGDESGAKWTKGKSVKDGKGEPKEGGGGGKGLTAVAAKSYDGVFKGKIVGKGDRDQLAKLDQQHEASLTGKTDADHCKKGNQHQYSYRIGANGNVGNVFVWIMPEKGQFFQVPEDQVKAHAKNVEMGQPGCNFTPHCFVLFPRYRSGEGGKKFEPTGQKLVVKNDDTVTHNTKVKGGPFNDREVGTLAAGKNSEIVLTPENVEVVVACNIHPYMQGFCRVFDHPWATVSNPGKDLKDPALGSFELKGLPTGVPVRLFVWHEKAGFLNQGGKDGQEITFKPGENESPAFEMSFPS